MNTEYFVDALYAALALTSPLQVLVNEKEVPVPPDDISPRYTIEPLVVLANILSPVISVVLPLKVKVLFVNSVVAFAPNAVTLLYGLSVEYTISFENNVFFSIIGSSNSLSLSAPLIFIMVAPSTFSCLRFVILPFSFSL